MFRRVLTHTAAGFDHAFRRVIHQQTRKVSGARAVESLPHHARLTRLRDIDAFYNTPEHLDSADAFVPPDPDAQLAARRVHDYGSRGAVFDLTWRSRARVLHPEVREDYHAVAPNHVATARLFAHESSRRPALLLLHGYLGGNFAFEERTWPVRWLYRQGFDVLVAIAPFHGERGLPSERLRPPFPGTDPRWAIEGFRQYMMDLRDLVAWLYRRGNTAVGAMGMSLGGYSAALLATVEPRLSFTVPMIPMASLADLAREGQRLVGTPEEQLEQHAIYERAMRASSPFGRAPLVPAERVCIIAGAGDRVTPITHAQRLARHFGAEVDTFVGGHILQFGRAEGFRAAKRLWERLELLPARR